MSKKSKSESRVPVIGKSMGKYFPAMLWAGELTTLWSPKKEWRWEVLKKHFFKPHPQGLDKSSALGEIEKLRKNELTAGKNVNANILWLTINRVEKKVDHLNEDAA